MIRIYLLTMKYFKFSHFYIHVKNEYYYFYFLLEIRNEVDIIISYHT